jgi:hypothetical protein
MAIVEQAVKQGTEAPTSSVNPANPGASRIVGYDPRGKPIVQRGWKTIEQIAARTECARTTASRQRPAGAWTIIREAP